LATAECREPASSDRLPVHRSESPTGYSSAGCSSAVEGAATTPRCCHGCGLRQRDRGLIANATARRAARPSILRIWSAGMPRSSKEKTPVYQPIGGLAPPATICPRSRATAPTASLCFRPFPLIRSDSRSPCRQRIGSGATLSGRCCWPVRVQISISTGALRRRSQDSARSA
jgi:hypothetical protein